METKETNEALKIFKNENISGTEDGISSDSGLYRLAPQVQEKAKEIITDYHPHLEDANIAFLLRTGTWKSKEQVVPGKAVTAPQMWRFVSGFDLVLMINELVWLNLTDKGRRALLDHKLSYFQAKRDKAGNVKWGTREPDLKEFSQVIKRHGICLGDPQPLKELAGQMNLQALQENIESEESLGGELDDDEFEDGFMDGQYG